MMQQKTISRLVPFSLTFAIVALDQLTKYLVSASVRAWSVGPSFFGDLVRIIHVYNPGIAFSLGGDLSSNVRSVLFGLLPLVMIGIIAWLCVRSDEFSAFQRWCIAGIAGGGLGNLVDRFFRAEGVLDFIDVKFFGLFGLERWPTFNVADSSVVVCGILLVLSFVIGIRSTGRKAK
jgi:signal peptidase II